MPLPPAEGPAADVGVTLLEMGVEGFSGSSLFFVEGVDALLDVPDRGLWGPGCSFLGILSIPFSLGDVVPLGGDTGSSEASSTTKSWSLFSPSLCC